MRPRAVRGLFCALITVAASPLSGANRSGVATAGGIKDDHMRFGLFGGAGVPRGDPVISALKLADYIETNVEAEALGYYATFLTEHHFTGVGQISAPLQVLTAIAM